MPEYIKASLYKYQHPAPVNVEHAPHKWKLPVYGAKTQYLEDEENTPFLSLKDVNHLQQLGDTLLYYTRALDLTLSILVNV
jgi:hypothetical protein